MSDDVMCCGVFEHLQEEGYHFPFEQPIIINRETHNLEVGDMAVSCFKQTSSGKISQSSKNILTIFIKYCPFCGKQIDTKKVEAA